MTGASRLALLALLAAACRAPGARADGSIAEVVGLKLKGVQQLLDHDWLSDLVALRDSEGGLARGLVEARFLAAAARGHPEEVLGGENGAALRDALLSGASAEAFATALRDALAAPEGTWVGLKEGFGSRDHLQAALRKLSALELRVQGGGGDAAVRVRAGGRREAEHVEAALGALRGHLWPLRRARAVWRAVAVCGDPFFARVPLEVTVWVVADGMLWGLACALPLVASGVGGLDWVARGQTGPFRGMLVALCVLLLVYLSVSIFVECVFFTLGVAERSWRMAARKLAARRKKKAS